MKNNGLHVDHISFKISEPLQYSLIILEYIIMRRGTWGGGESQFFSLKRNQDKKCIGWIKLSF